MKHNPLKRSVLLTLVVGAACLAWALAAITAPMAIRPRFDLVMILALSLIALTLDAYLDPQSRLSWPALLANTVLGGVAFGLLAWCAGVAGEVPAWVLGLTGAAVFGIACLLYTAALERIATGPKALLAPAGTALMLFLAGQCLSGLL